MRRLIVSLFLLTVLTPSLSSRERPNIVLMMADDMGYSDIGCYGGEIQTPHLNRLAEDGLRYQQFYNTSRCCPTRASLLTGLYPHQAGVGHMMEDKGYPAYRGNINRNCQTIAEVLRPTGYATYMSGKWHVAKDVAPDGPKFNWPLQRGFDRFFGTIHGAGSFYDPNSLTRDNTQIAPGTEDFYYTDAIADNAVQFITQHNETRSNDPFFLYVAFTAPHWPMHAKPEDIAKYRGAYQDGWDALRASRFERMREMGILDPAWTLSDRDPTQVSWDETDNKEWHERRMEVYAAMVDSMDQNIGRIVEALERSGELENTLVFFLADNGGCAEENGSSGAKRTVLKDPSTAAPMAPGELQRRMVPTVTREGLPLRQGIGVIPGPADTYVAYGKGWANASNTPFRRYKHWVHEGGISTPLIAHWPAGIQRKGEWDATPGHLIDIMATCVDVAQAAYPASVDGHPIQPLEGTSLAPTFTGGTLDTRPLFWEHEGNRAVRLGEWKLVSRHNQPWELFNLTEDRSETNNLIEERPSIAAELLERYESWAQRAGVQPWPVRKRN